MSCKHDWEIIKKAGLCTIWEEVIPDESYEERIIIAKALLRKYKHKMRDSNNQDFVQKVCLSCGECIDEIKEVEDFIKEKSRSKRNRQKLAKKVWECCKQE